MSTPDRRSHGVSSSIVASSSEAEDCFSAELDSETDEEDSDSDSGSCSVGSSTSDLNADDIQIQSKKQKPRRSRPLPVVFFGTPSTAEHQRRAKYERRLRERRVLRRDSLDLARRRTMTTAELQAALYHAPRSESSQAQECSDSGSQSRLQTSEQSHASPRVSALAAESEQEDEEEPSSPTLLAQAEHDMDAFLTSAKEEDEGEIQGIAMNDHTIEPTPRETTTSEC